MLEILYVFGGEKASGAEKVIERLIRHNINEVKPHLFVAPGAYADDLQTRDSDIRITVVSALKKLNRSNTKKLNFFWLAIVNNLKIAAQVIKYIDQNKIDVVHANTIVPAFYLFPAICYAKAFKKKVKFIWSDHDLKYFSSFENKLAQFAYKIYDRTLAVSNAVKAKYPDGHKALTLYNGIDINEFLPDESSGLAFRVKYGFTQTQIIIGIAGTIEPRKGQASLIKVFKLLVVKHPELRLVLAGPLSADFDQYSKEVLSAVNETEQIIYTGRLSDMCEMYNGCDIIINNSNLSGSEPLGTTIYEAMAVKKVVVASNTGGSPEIIDNNVDGFLFECDSEEQLLETLENVLAKYSSLNALRNKAREKVENKFYINIMANRYNQLIASILK